LKYPTVGEMSEEDMATIVSLYTIAHLTKEKVGAALKALKAGFPRYPGWGSMSMFLVDERLSFAFSERAKSNPFKKQEASFRIAQQIVEQIASRYVRGYYSITDCTGISNALLQYELNETGRVSLGDFYLSGLGTRFFFVETPNYLQALGALDQADPRMDKVIVANYLLSATNCASQGSVYSECCINKCEELLGKIEMSIVAPTATPEQIAAFVSSLSSETIHAPRILSPKLLRRLDEIAIPHGGQVHLHGRLFLQWMHMAFPRECPYPHASGVVTTLDSDSWAEQNGQAYRIDDAWNWNTGEAKREVKRFVENIKPKGDLDNVQPIEDAMELAWSHEEELVSVPQRSLFSMMSFASCRMTQLSVLTLLLFAARRCVVSNSKGGCAKDSSQVFV